jgi:hypothetical protein
MTLGYYIKHMQFVRRTLLVLLGALLPLLLLATAFDFGAYHVVGTPTPLKKTLSDSGIYNSVVSQALEQAKTTSSGYSQIPLQDPAIKKAAEESFSPQFVQSSSEKVIDGVYNWLRGKSSQPDFNVDLSSAKNNFAEKVGQVAKAKAATLPLCTSVPASKDSFNATCLPPGITPAQVGLQAKNDVLYGNGFLEHSNITASSIKSSNGNPVFSSGKLKNAPKYYQLSTKLPYILIGLSLLNILAIIFLSSTRRKGLRHVSFTFAIVGVFLLAFAWGLNRVVAQNFIPQINFDNKVFESNVRILSTDITHSIDRNYWIFGIAYFSLGFIVLLVTFLKGRESGTKAPGPPNKPAASTELPKQSDPKTAYRPQPRPAQQRPKPRPRIQG